MKSIIKCAGVPEHYNLPWKTAIEKGLFKNIDIDLEWQDNGGGTGAMFKDLADGKIDLAVTLTEGAIKNIYEGNPSKMISFYVNSPLLWGVHTSSQSDFNISQFDEDSTFAISRFTSGSHLMAYVYAQDHGIEPTEKNFAVIQNLDGARKSLAENLNQLFLWEKYTTKPYVDSGELKCIDYCPTPWSPFVIVASNQLIQENSTLIEQIVAIVLTEAKSLKENSETIQRISKDYNLGIQDATDWFNAVEWCSEKKLSLSMLQKISNTLIQLGLIDTMPNFEKCIMDNFIVNQ